MISKFMSRRDFLRIGGLAAAATALGACAPQVVKEVVEVTREVDVEVTREVEIESEPQVTTIVEQAEPITIRIHARMGTQGDHFAHFAHLFNEEHHPDIFVKTELVPGADYYQKLDTMIAGGTLGDAFWIWLGGGFYQYAATGVYAALDDIVDASGYDLTQFFPESVEALRYQGTLYSLPWILNNGSASAVYYSKPLFDAAGVDYPTSGWTWDEMTETAKALTDLDAGIWGLATQNYYAGSPLGAARAYGGDLIAPDGTKTNLDSPRTLEGLQVFSDLYHVHKVSPSSSEISGNWYQNMAAGTLAMFQTGFWGKTIDDYVAPGSWGVVATPKGPEGRGNTMFVDMIGVTSASKHPAETFEYLTDCCSYEAGMDIWQVRASVPGCRPDVWNSEAALADPHFKVYSDVMNEDGMPPQLPMVANFRVKAYWQVINEGLEPIWTGEKTADEVIDDVLEAAQAVLDQPSLLA